MPCNSVRRYAITSDKIFGDQGPKCTQTARRQSERSVRRRKQNPLRRRRRKTVTPIRGITGKTRSDAPNSGNTSAVPASRRRCQSPLPSRWQARTKRRKAPPELEAKILRSRVSTRFSSASASSRPCWVDAICQAGDQRGIMLDIRERYRGATAYSRRSAR
jgi:hypothetical protein